MGALLKRKRTTIKTKSQLGNERGLAMIEAVPLLTIFVVLISYGLGMWGAVHTAILQSMGARTYAFSTFRNRTNLVVFRDDATSTAKHHQLQGIRFHAINDRPTPDASEGFLAAARPIALGRDLERSTASVADHNQRIFAISGRNEEGGVESSPIWVMIGYGMCLNANCGEQ